MEVLAHPPFAPTCVFCEPTDFSRLPGSGAVQECIEPIALQYPLQRAPSAGALQSRALPHEVHANGGPHTEDTLAQQLSIDQKPGGAGGGTYSSRSAKAGSGMYLGRAGAATDPLAARSAMSFESCRSPPVEGLIVVMRATTLLL